MGEPKYDEDVVNLGFLKKQMSETERNINNEYKEVSRHYASRPTPPYTKGDTWIDGNIVYTCINSREIGVYNEEDWATESGAKAEAERKNKIFLTKPSKYISGDMWILQSDEDHKAGKKGEILIATAGQNGYNEDDWVNMLGYGNISSINEVANNLSDAITRIGVVEEAVKDGVIVTYYQNTIPEAKNIGDLWYVTADINTFKKGKMYRYDGANWIILDDPSITEAFSKANEARLIADGKIQSFYSETEPKEGMGVGDLWINVADNNKLYRYNGTNWIPVYDTRVEEMKTSIETISKTIVNISTDLGKITQQVSTVEENIADLGYKDEVEAITELYIENAGEGYLLKLQIQGNKKYESNLFPRSNLYPRSLLHPNQKGG